MSRQPSAGDRQGIEYLLTLLGESLRPVLEALIEWGAHHAKELDEVHRLPPCDAVARDRIPDADWLLLSERYRRIPGYVRRSPSRRHVQAYHCRASAVHIA